MTVSTTQNSTTMSGNGSDTVFNFTFNSSVPVGQTLPLATFSLIYTDATGSQTILSPTQYTIIFTAAAPGTLWGNGGSIIYPISGLPIASGTTLTLQRIFPLQQLTAIRNQGDFSPQVIEQALDVLEMQAQQISSVQSKAIQFPVVDSTSLNSILPAAAARANQYLSFDVSGNVTTSSQPSNTPTDLSNYFATAAGGTTSRTLAQHFADVVYVRDRGVKWDGTTDDTAAINALTAGSPSNTLFVFPEGTGIFTSELTFNLKNNCGITGAGAGITVFHYTGASTTTDLLYFPDGSTNFENISLSSFSVSSATTMTAGCAIHLHQTYAWLKDVQTVAIPNNLWNGIWADQPGWCFMYGVVATAQNDAFLCSALGVGTPYQYDVYATNCKFYSAGNAGFHVGGGIDNVNVIMSVIANNKYNVLSDNAASAYGNQRIVIGEGCVIDAATASGVYINDTHVVVLNGAFISIAASITNSILQGINVVNFNGGFVQVNCPTIQQNGGDGIGVADAGCIMSVSPTTYINNNGGYGISAGFAWNKLYGKGISLGNTTGSYGSNVITRGSYVPSDGVNSCTIDCTQSSIGIANGAHSPLPVMSGFVAINNSTGGNDVALWVVGGGVAVLIGASSQGNWVSSTATPASGKTSIHFDGTYYQIYNNSGGTQGFTMETVRLSTGT